MAANQLLRVIRDYLEFMARIRNRIGNRHRSSAYGLVPFLINDLGKSFREWKFCNLEIDKKKLLNGETLWARSCYLYGRNWKTTVCKIKIFIIYGIYICMREINKKEYTNKKISLIWYTVNNNSLNYTSYYIFQAFSLSYQISYRYLLRLSKNDDPVLWWKHF